MSSCSPEKRGAIDLDALIDDFVRVHAGMTQRGAAWYAAMGLTVGGSELAALTGADPYKTLEGVVRAKIAILDGESTWDGGSEACWWGVLFEDVIAAYTAVDLGSPVRGDEICVRAVAGHRNSPDGYLVAQFYRAADGQLRIWTTDMPPGIRTQKEILLLEFKCPFTRKPQQRAPAQYRPQLWSGLAVSPIAHQGLFVDAVFRKCPLLDLGDTPGYDTEYHDRDAGAWEHPIAWSLVAVYAPLLAAPLHVRLGWRGPEWAPGDPSSDEPDADAALAAWQVHTAYFGLALKDQGRTRDLADLGDMDRRLFGRALGLIDRKRFPTRLAPPCFADGRGLDLHSDRAVGALIEDLRGAAPEHHWLLGVLPWKLFEVVYAPVARRPGFLDEVAPLIEEVHRTVAGARASGDPEQFLAEWAAARPGRAAASSGFAPEKSWACDEAALQGLFDSLAPESSEAKSGSSVST
jgi:hypothetical protein